MPNPKRRHSKMRGRNRRAHWKAEAVEVGKCPKCKSPKLSHRLCGTCGYYDGQQVLDFESKKIKKEEKKSKKR
ncbi:MAG: 50S ribosomal protein L32 [Candidatus Omnitrophota bacterium]